MPPRRFAALNVAIVTGLLLASTPARAERITRFESTITPIGGERIRVLERVSYDLGAARRYEVERVLPRELDGRPVRVRIESVTDDNGQPCDFTLVGDDTLIIESGARPLAGDITFRIDYEVRGAVSVSEQGADLRWPITGVQAPLAVDEVVATLVAPSAPIAASCSVGTAMAMGGAACEVERGGGRTRFRTARALAPGETLWIHATLTESALSSTSSAPGAPTWRSLGWLLPCAALSWVVVVGARSGWRVRSRHAIERSPVKLPPGHAAALRRGRASVSDLATSLIDLARRGHLAIEVVELDGFVDLRAWDHLLVRTGARAGALTPFEAAFIEIVFEMSNRVPVHRLRLLAGDGARMTERLFEDLTAAGLTAGSPRRATLRRVNAGALLAVGAVASLVAGWPEAAAGLLASAGVLLVAAPIAPVRTPRGRRVARDIDAWRRYLATASQPRDAIAAAVELVAALGLGVADAWADRCAETLPELGPWYREGDAVTTDSARTLSRLGRLHVDLHRAMTTRAPVRREFRRSPQ